MDFLNSIIGQVNTVLWSYVLIALLILSGLFYTLRTGFAQGRLLGDMVALITGKLSSLKDGEKKVAGQVTGFQAFCIAVASHVGTGNLAGVAIAVVVGGPGALFWMWIIALLGGATSLIENTLAQTYKVKDGKGGFRGGPSYYMEKALGQKTLGYIFSVIVIVTFAFVFNTVQANTIAQAFERDESLQEALAGEEAVRVSLRKIIVGHPLEFDAALYENEEVFKKKGCTPESCKRLKEDVKKVSFWDDIKIKEKNALVFAHPLYFLNHLNNA